MGNDKHKVWEPPKHWKPGDPEPNPTPDTVCSSCGAPKIRPNFCWPCRAVEIAAADDG